MNKDIITQCKVCDEDMELSPQDLDEKNPLAIVKHVCIIFFPLLLSGEHKDLNIKYNKFILSIYEEKE